MDSNLDHMQFHKTHKDMIALERFFPHHIRDNAERLLFSLSVFFLSIAVFLNVITYSILSIFWPIAEGLFLFCFGLLLFTILIEVYFHSLRMRLLYHHDISFSVLVIIGIHHPLKKDLTLSFLHSLHGREIMMRLGVAKEQIHHFIKDKQKAVIDIPSEGKLHDFASHIYDEDPYFRDFLERIKINKDDLTLASKAVDERHHRHLSSKPILSHMFGRENFSDISLEHVLRNEIEDIEHGSKIIITEQAVQMILKYLRDDMVKFSSKDDRVEIIMELIEYCLSMNHSRFHGASVIMPADARSFFIHKKALI